MKKSSHKESVELLAVKNKRTIHFDNPDYLPFLMDKEFQIILLDSMRRCGHTLNLFARNKSNEEFKKLLINRREWINKALKDPLLKESDKALIRNIGDRFTFRRDDQLWSTLAEDLTPAFNYLIKLQKDKKLLKGRRHNGKKTARYFLLDALSKFYPNNSEVKFDEDNEFSMEEKISKHLK